MCHGHDSAKGREANVIRGGVNVAESIENIQGTKRDIILQNYMSVSDVHVYKRENCQVDGDAGNYGIKAYVYGDVEKGEDINSPIIYV